MYNRILLTELRKWRVKTNRKPLVLRGARQVGKTTLVKQFGKEFDNFVPLNLETDDVNVFRHSKNVNEIWQYICLRFHITNNSGKQTLLFIDEIQEDPSVISMLRYFFEQLPEVHVIAAGSRLQSLTKEGLSFPVGRVEYLTLRPFSFIEYIEAKEGSQWAEMISNVSVPSILHDEMMKAFNTFALIGGMPEVVSKYISTNNIESLSPIYNSLLNGYNEDAEKFATSREQVSTIRHILTTAWSSAAETIKFAGFAKSSYTSTKVHDVMNLFERAFLLSLDYPVTATSLPAIPSLKRSPKLIMLDSGLTNFFSNIQLEYLQNQNLLDTWRGRAAEQIVAQELRNVLDRCYQDKQFFWVRDKKGTTAEIDFVWPSKDGLIPIEVKSGTNSHLRSLHAFVNNSEERIVAFRIWNGELSVQQVTTPAPISTPYTLVNIPFYYSCVLDKVYQKILSLA